VNKIIPTIIVVIVAVAVVVAVVVYSRTALTPDTSTVANSPVTNANDGKSSSDSRDEGINDTRVLANSSDEIDRPTPVLSWRGQFSELLREGYYAQAVDLYTLVFTEDAKQAKPLNDVLIAYLKSMLSSNDNFSLQELATIYLEIYPEDEDVLLLLAQSYEKEEEFILAIEAYGAMYANALRSGDEKEVATKLARFVQGMETKLRRNFRYMELLEAYQLIDELGMGNPYFNLRIAQLYFQLGYLYDAELVAQSILDNGFLADQAQALLNKISPEKFENKAVRLNSFGGSFGTYARINNRVGMMLLVDTGASISVITPKAFSRVSDGADFIGVRDINTAGGVVEAEIYRLNMVRVGDEGVENLEFAVLDFKPGGNISGLLGMNFLQNFQFEIDTQKKLLYLRN